MKYKRLANINYSFKDYASVLELCKNDVDLLVDDQSCDYFSNQFGSDYMNNFSTNKNNQLNYNVEI